MRQLPATVVQLIEQLEVSHPPRCIQPNESPEDAHRYAGGVALIADLRARYEAALKKEVTTLAKTNLG